MLIGQYRSRSPGRLRETRVVRSSTGRSEHSAPLDVLVGPGSDLVALARLVMNDLVSAFGLPEVQQITADGELVLDRFQADFRPRVERWAQAASVPVIPSWPGG